MTFWCGKYCKLSSPFSRIPGFRKRTRCTERTHPSKRPSELPASKIALVLSTQDSNSLQGVFGSCLLKLLVNAPHYVGHRVHVRPIRIFHLELGRKHLAGLVRGHPLA